MTKEELAEKMPISLAIRELCGKLQVYAFVGRFFIPEVHPYGKIVRETWKIDDREFDDFDSAENALFDKLLELFAIHFKQ